MKYWEFLIQKEGDQTWLPLETQQVEILEGRYRVVAHTDRANTPVAIRVSQLITHEMPPRQRVRKRTSSTNESGLVVVMPFVHLQPGQWKLKCSSVDAVGDMLGDGWQYDVQLQVFAESEEDWSNEWPVPEDELPMLDESVNESDSETDLVNADLPLLQAQAELQQQVKGPLGESPGNSFGNSSGESSGREADSVSDLAYQVMLKQQAYLSRRDQPMTIVGKVRALAGSIDETVDAAASQLWIRLQNPQTAGVIMEAHRPLSLARLPADFKVQVQLPNEVKTRVVLGEVSLRTAAVDGEGLAKVLASTAFTITAGIDQILDAIANQDPGTFEEEISMLSGSDGADIEPAREPSVPSFDMTQKGVVPAGSAVLPPQLEKRLAEESLVESLDELPTQVGSSSLIDLPTFEQVALSQLLLEQPTEQVSPTQVSSSQVNSSQTEATKRSNDQTDRQTDDSKIQLADKRPDEQPASSLDQYRYPTDGSAEDAALPVADSEAAPAVESPVREEAVDLPDDIFDRPAVQPAPKPTVVSAPAQFVGTSIEDSDLEADEIAAALDDIDQDLLEEPSALDALEAPGIEGVVEALPRASKQSEAARLSVDSKVTAAIEPSQSAGQRPARKSGREVEASLAFQSLKLKDHFWQRLSTLNRQSHEEATKLAENIEAAGVSRGDGFSSLAPMSSALEGYADDEVVIYDEPSISESVSSRSDEPPLEEISSKRDSIGRYGDPQANLNALREGGKLLSNESLMDQSVGQFESQPAGQVPGASAAGMPIQASQSGLSAAARGADASDVELPEMALPVISLPIGDLVAGQTVTVTVRSRPSTYKPFIKLWMVDRQSRNLVIEPKILTNLRPDALGDLQGAVELPVPMDCLDVQIAAIAIDMATQQESGKAVINRRVVPASQSSTRRGFSF